jgi:hypothetical protein
MGKIPFGSNINSATLTVTVFNDSNTAMQMSMYRMLTNWDQNVATFSSFGSIGGVQASEGEAEGLPPDAILFDSSTGTKTFDVKLSLQHWATGESNFGWLIERAAPASSSSLTFPRFTPKAMPARARRCSRYRGWVARPGRSA